MQENIEFKAHCADGQALRSLAIEAGAELKATTRQRDTYFVVREGRLKLRQIDNSSAELIRYYRQNSAEARKSTYSIKQVRFPRLVRLWLSLRYGKFVEVRKKRELWMWRGVRIHIDNVDGLGNYMELEAVVDKIGNQQEAERRCRMLMTRLNISESQLVADSYADMLAEK